MTTTQPKLLTADDLLRLHSEGVRGELIRGVLLPFTEDHTLDGADVLSGFSCTVSDLFDL